MTLKLTAFLTVLNLMEAVFAGPVSQPPGSQEVVVTGPIVGAENAQRGAQTSLDVAVAPQELSLSEANPQSLADKENTRVEHGIYVATVWLVVVTAVLSIFTGLMWWWTRKLAKQSEDNAQKAHTLNRDLFTASHRPWLKLEVVLADHILYSAQDGWSVTVEFTVENVGAGPAVNVSPTANVIPYMLGAYSVDDLKGRDPRDMPQLGTETHAEMEKIVSLTKRGPLGFGKTLFGGEKLKERFRIHCHKPLFDSAKELPDYSGHFNLVFGVVYGFTFDDSLHVTAKAYTIYKNALAGGGKIDLAGESINRSHLAMTQMPQATLDRAT